MKIAFGMIVFNGNYVLRECLESVYPFANQILIAEGPVEYWQRQGYTTSIDGTNDILDSFPDPENKITITHGQYKEKGEQCNAYIKHLKDDNDYLWNLDSDEIFKEDDIKKMMRILKKHKYTSVGFKSCSFYGGFNKYVGGFENEVEFIRVHKIYPGSYWKKHRPPTVAHKIDRKKIFPTKHLSHNQLYKLSKIQMYHYSYVFPDQVEQKTRYYSKSLSKDYIIPNYFDNIYKPWILGDHKQKESIENKYNGVHEFKPEKRSQSFTKNFEGKHPKNINKNLTDLKLKLKKQLEKYAI